MFSNNKSAFPQCEGEKSKDEPGLEPLPEPRTFGGRIETDFAVRVLPPYRGGILLRAFLSLQPVFLHFFYTVKAGDLEALASKISDIYES